MDLSKIPGKTPVERANEAAPSQPAAQPVAPANAVPGVVVSDVIRPPRSTVPFELDGGGGGLEGYLSASIGALILLMYPRFLQWTSHALFGTPFNQFANPDGTVVPYPQVVVFFSDLGVTMFGAALAVEGLILLSARRCAWALYLAAGFMAVATVYNAWYVVTSYSTSGLATASALAVVLGIYSVLQVTRRANALRV